MKRFTAAGAAAILSVTALGGAIVVSRSGHSSTCAFRLNAAHPNINFVIATLRSSDTTPPTEEPTPVSALGQALASGQLPGPAQTDGWIRLPLSWPDLVVYFRGIGVTSGGAAQPGRLVMGDVASFTRENGGWSLAGTTWHYCDPKQGRAHRRLAHVEEDPGDVDYTLSFPRQVRGHVGAECSTGAVDTVNGDANHVTDIFTPTPLSGVDLTSLKQCVATHQGTLTVRAQPEAWRR
jgi:hypothetical protein